MGKKIRIIREDGETPLSILLPAFFGNIYRGSRNYGSRKFIPVLNDSRHFGTRFIAVNYNHSMTSIIKLK